MADTRAINSTKLSDVWSSFISWQFSTF